MFEYVEYFGMHIDQVAQHAQRLEERLQSILERTVSIQNDERK